MLTTFAFLDNSRPFLLRSLYMSPFHSVQFLPSRSEFTCLSLWPTPGAVPLPRYHRTRHMSLLAAFNPQCCSYLITHLCAYQKEDLWPYVCPSHSSVPTFWPSGCYVTAFNDYLLNEQFPWINRLSSPNLYPLYFTCQSYIIFHTMASNKMASRSDGNGNVLTDKKKI